MRAASISPHLFKEVRQKQEKKNGPKEKLVR
jgi:hypothetical protein